LPAAISRFVAGMPLMSGIDPFDLSLSAFVKGALQCGRAELSANIDGHIVRITIDHPVGLNDDAWLTLGEAAGYLKRSASAVRSLIQRGVLAPDGRGPRGTHMFRLATLDRFLGDGAARYAPGRQATAGASGEPDATNEISRSSQAIGRSVSRAHQGARPEDRQDKGSKEGARSRNSSRGSKRKGSAARGARSRTSSSKARSPSGLRTLVAEWQAAHVEAEHKR
jgi:hypothetical protein